MLSEWAETEIENLYENEDKYQVVDAVYKTLAPLTQNAINILRFARFTLIKAEMQARQFLFAEFTTVMIEAGLSEKLANEIEACFDECFDLDQYISAVDLESLEVSLVKKDIVDDFFANKNDNDN